MADVNLMDQAYSNPDLASIEALLNGEVPEELKNEEVVEEEGEPTSAKAKEEPEAKQEEVEEEEAPQSIATKSGKGQIPYAVLQSERERRQAAEQAMQQMQQRLEAAQRAQATGQRQTDSTDAVETTDDELSEISNDFPQIGKVIKQLQSKLENTEAQLQQVRSLEQSRAEVEQTNAQKSVQEAMDEHPALLHWQAKEPELFAQAIEIDQSLQNNPKFSHLSLTDRFAKVVSAMEAIHGKAEVDTEAPTEEEPKVSNEKLVELAKEAAAKASKGGKPRTLSDMPGGLAPQSEDSKLENMTASDLAGMFANKSPEEIAAFVAKYG